MNFYAPYKSAAIPVLLFVCLSAACDVHIPPPVNNAPKEIIITGLPAAYTSAMCYIFTPEKNDTAAVSERAEILNGTAALPLQRQNKIWRGYGLYRVVLMLGESPALCLYTNGKSLEELAVTDAFEDIPKLPSIFISQAATVIPFTKFAQAPLD